ncbi:hypothetical protein RBWH47_00099 [Rhodopirellula baltica WH47]|uniref:Uncharacterized protein n=1 Tax=Rhodopirellula baltica WH47 TaxID=991778 RepID=F2B0J9_RHOBT|nr:hypothetical protein RBWH47_00099 [Rhodopirellula baltica WH47]
MGSSLVSRSNELFRDYATVGAAIEAAFRDHIIKTQPQRRF